MAALLLLGGTDEQNGDYSLLRDVAEGLKKRTPGWSTLKDAVAGDEVWFYFPRPVSAITAHGIAANDARPGHHWDYEMNVESVTWLPSPVQLSELRERFPQWRWTRIARNRTRLPPEVARFLQKRGTSQPKRRGDTTPRLPEEVAEQEYREGHSVRIAVNRYERDRRARAACLANHGSGCSICGISLENIYGPEVRGLVHVHHVVPLSQTRSSYTVNPAKDLIPVCPNCHAVVHSRVPAYSPREVQRMIRKRRPR